MDVPSNPNESSVVCERSDDRLAEQKMLVHNLEITLKVEKITKSLLENKEPITKLNEIMAILRTRAEYTLISSVNLASNSFFTFRVMCGKILIAYGTEKSKIEAKQSSAAIILNKIDNMDATVLKLTIRNLQSDREPKETLLDKSKKAYLEFKSELNPIGALQELSIASCGVLPTYDIIPNTNYNGVFGYTVFCSLQSFKTKGLSVSKQSAKRHAAYLMFEKVKDKLQCTSTASENVFSKKNRPIDLAPETMTPEHILIKNFKLSKNPGILTLNDLVSTDGVIIVHEAVEMLEMIGKEEGFSPSYLILSDKSGEIIVKLTIDSIVSFFGAGKTTLAAKEAAAFDVLVFIKQILEM